MKFSISVFVFICVFTPIVKACDCVNIVFNEAIELMDEIFIGTVVDIERSYEYDKEDDYTIGYYIYTFEVSKKWKGDRKNKVRVIEYDTSCSIGHKLGEEYLIFGEYNENKSELIRSYYWAGMCSRSIATKYYSDSKSQDWIWDDRDSLDIQFPSPIQTASFFNYGPLWMILVIVSIGVFILYIRKGRLHKSVSG